MRPRRVRAQLKSMPARAAVARRPRRSLLAMQFRALVAGCNSVPVVLLELAAICRLLQAVPLVVVVASCRRLAAPQRRPPAVPFLSALLAVRLVVQLRLAVAPFCRATPARLHWHLDLLQLGLVVA